MNNNKRSIKTNSPRSTLPIAIAFLLVTGFAVSSWFYYLKDTERKIAKTEKELQKANDAKSAYELYSLESKQNTENRRKIDSLKGRNADIFEITSDKHFALLDSKYTMDKFFDNEQIVKINRVLWLHLNKIAADNDVIYSLVRPHMPINSKTPLRAFEDIVDYLGITPIELIPYGVEFDKGEIFQFYNENLQNLFYKYLDDYESAYRPDEYPDFKLSELDPIRTEYTKNCDDISRLENQIARNDSIFNKKLEQFDAERDSLNRVIKNLKSKLK